ncbi:MAG: 50S ribosomal protein L18 [Spirochaetia bacterium]|jgi:large subunit ribosomal protein L18|nr:50S ribosomal protein L18 [Spirochaetia bacterium]
MKRVNDKKRKQLKRKIHIRKRISGTPERPRLTVFRSNKHVYVQVIDDTKGVTIASASNIEAEFKGLKNNVADAEKIGQAIGERLAAKKIEAVVFDRNGYLYHGIVKSIADGARKSGLKF